jgi:vitamin B12/bleomycin/antimicrobial peptide transport system ATP-binding/permease protein
MIESVHITWSRLSRVLRLFFSSEVRWQAITWFVLLLVLLTAISGLNVVNSYVGRDFMTAISERKSQDYAVLAVLYVCVFAGSTVVAVCSRFSEERLRLLWREWLTKTLMGRYLSDHTHYRLKTREEVDNPDQRMTEDVKSYTQTMLSFFLMTLNATITSLAFLGVLWSITPWLVLVAIGYATLGSATTIVLGRRLVSLANLQLKKEADLRYDLIQVRNASESIAVMRVAGAVGARLIDRLRALVENNKLIIAVTRNVGFVIIGYNYLIQLIPLLIVAPLYIQGKVEFGVVTQSAMAFAQVLGAFSLIVTQFETLSSFAAVTERLNTIIDAIAQAQSPSSNVIEVIEDDGHVAFERLTLWTPRDHRALIRNLSLTLPDGCRLLISGPNAAGKTALFLAASGIWEDGVGRITRPLHNAIVFVPHRPFTMTGTLREILLITMPSKSFSDDELVAVLRKVGLDTALRRLGGLHAEHDWATVLSPPELQFLSIARLLLARPRYAFLDRVSEALGPEHVEHLYHLLDESSITYLSTGEEHNLLSYHDMVLELFDGGGWRVTRTRDPVEVRYD